MSYGRYKLFAHQTPKENSNSKLNAVNYAHVFYVELKPDGKHSQAIQLVMLRFVMRWIKRGAYRWSAAQPMINSLNLDLEYWVIFTRNNRTRGEPFDMVDTLSMAHKLFFIDSINFKTLSNVPTLVLSEFVKLIGSI